MMRTILELAIYVWFAIGATVYLIVHAAQVLS